MVPIPSSAMREWWLLVELHDPCPEAFEIGKSHVLEPILDRELPLFL